MTQHNFIWSDEGSDADEDVFIWQPVDVERGYYPPGDAATPTHKKPTISSMTVSALVPDALAPPTDFTEVWNDGGSGADEDVRIMNMNPPQGYICLGQVAVNGYSNRPNKDQYQQLKFARIKATMSI